MLFVLRRNNIGPDLEELGGREGGRGGGGKKPNPKPGPKSGKARFVC